MKKEGRNNQVEKCFREVQRGKNLLIGLLEGYWQA
jgi:hypothetical protein